MESKKIFISGPSDVNDICNSLKEYLLKMGYAVVRMPFPASPKPPADVSIRELRRCDTMVLVLSKSIGSIPKDQLPITIQEYEEAMAGDIPIFTYINENINENEREEELKQFIKQRLEEEKKITYKFFNSSNLNEFNSRVFTTLDGFRWIPKCFLSVSGWEYYLLNTYFARTRLPDNTESKQIPGRIGRRDEAKKLTEWLQKNNGKIIDIFIITGKIGYGKTLFVYHTLKQVLESEEKLLKKDDIMILLKDSEVKLEHISEITPDRNSPRPVLVVVEDADRQQSNIGKLLQHISARNDAPRFKLILSVQEQYFNTISSWCELFFKEDNIISLLRYDFSNTETKDDINKIQPLLDSGFNILDRHTKGIPFYVDLFLKTIVSGKRPEEIRKQDLERYILRQVDENLKNNLLLPMALLCPIKEDEIDEIIPKIETHLDNPLGINKFKSELQTMVSMGIIGKYGRKYKVIPEILQDIIILRTVGKDDLVSITLNLMKELDDELLEHLISNLFRALWKDSPLKNENRGIMESISSELIKGLFEQDSDTRYKVLKIFANITYYIPEYAGDVAESIYIKYFNQKDNKISPSSHDDDPLSVTQREIEIEKASEIAYWAAIATASYRQRKKMFNILWDLGKNDLRTTSSNPDHPLRRLEDLAKFKQYKFEKRAYEFYWTLLSGLKKWLKEFEKSETPQNTPLAIISKLLDFEWENISSIYSGITLHHGYILYDKRIEEIKICVLKILINSFKNKTLLKKGAYFHQGLRNIKGILRFYAGKEWQRLSATGFENSIGLIRYYLDEGNQVPAFRVVRELEDYRETIKEHQNKTDLEDKIKEIEENYKSRFPDEYCLLDALTEKYYTFYPDGNKVGMLPDFLMENGKNAENNFKFLKRIHLSVESINWSIYNISLATWKLNDKEKQDVWAMRCLELAELIVEQDESSLFSGAGPHFLTNIRKHLTETENEILRQRYLEILTKYIEKANKLPDSNVHKVVIEYELRRFFWFLLKEKITLFDEEKNILKGWKYEPDSILGFTIDELSKKESELALAKDIVLNIETENDKKKADQKCEIIYHSEKIKKTISVDELKKLLEEMIEIPDISQENGYFIQELLVFFSNINEAYANLIFEFFIKRLKKYIIDRESDYKPLPWSIENSFKGMFKDISKERRKDCLRVARDRIYSEKEDEAFGGYNVSLFAILADGYSEVERREEAAQVLEEWVENVEPNQLITITRIIENSYSEFVFDYPNLIIKILNAAKILEAQKEGLIRIAQSNLAMSCELEVSWRTIGTVSDKWLNMERRAKEIIERYRMNRLISEYQFYYRIIQRAQQEMGRERLWDEEYD